VIYVYIYEERPEWEPTFSQAKDDFCRGCIQNGQTGGGNPFSEFQVQRLKWIFEEMGKLQEGQRQTYDAINLMGGNQRPKNRDPSITAEFDRLQEMFKGLLDNEQTIVDTLDPILGARGANVESKLATLVNSVNQMKRPCSANPPRR
jgi:hypothetical protein